MPKTFITSNEREFENAFQNMQLTSKRVKDESTKIVQHLEKTTSTSKPFLFTGIANTTEYSSDISVNAVFENEFNENEDTDLNISDLKYIDDLEEDGNTMRFGTYDNAIVENDSIPTEDHRINSNNDNVDHVDLNNCFQGSSKNMSAGSQSTTQDLYRSYTLEKQNCEEKSCNANHLNDENAEQSTDAEILTDEPDYYDSEDEFSEFVDNSTDDMHIESFFPPSHPEYRGQSRSKDRYCYGVDQYLQFPTFMRSIRKFAHDNQFEVANSISNGNCMFHAIADQLNINGEFQHTANSMRQKAITYLRKNPYHNSGSLLESFLSSETWDEYLSRMENASEWGDHMMLKALSDSLNMVIIVFNVYEDDIRQTEIIPDSNHTKRYRQAAYLGHIGEFHYLSLRPSNWEKQWPYKSLVQRLCSFYTKLGKESTTRMVQQRIQEMGIRKYVDQAKLSIPTFNEHVTVSSGTMKQMDGSTCDELEMGRTEETLHQMNTYGLQELQLQENEDSLRLLVEDPLNIDVLTGIPMPHLSFFIRHNLLSKMILAWGSTVCRSGYYRDVYIEYIGSIMDITDVTYEDCSKTRDIYRSHCTTQKRVPRAIVFRRGDSVERRILIDTEHTHPGYCRLKPFSKEVFNESEIYQDGSTLYLKGFPLPEHINKTFSMGKCYAGYECPLPTAMDEWRRRRKPFNWPTAGMVRDILHSGCSVIYKSHPNSDLPLAEWQINFWRAERILTTRWPQAQRYAFQVFKILIDYMTSHLEVKLKTKHLKAVFFYASEQIPEEAWYRCSGGCFLFVLSSLVECLKKKCIPHYFMPSNNIIDYYSVEEIQTICVYVESARLFPIEAVRFLSERHGFYCSSKLAGSVFSDCSLFAKDRDLSSVVHKSFIPNTVRVSKFFTKRGYYQASYNLLKDVFENVLLNLGSELEPPSFIEFLKNILRETRDKTSRQILAKQFDNECGTNLLKCYQSKSLKTVKEALPFEIVDCIGVLQIPNEHVTDLSSIAAYLDRFGYEKYKQRNAKVASAAFQLAIKCIRFLLDEQIMDENGVEDEILKGEILSQKDKMNSSLIIYYIHIYLVSVLRSTLLPLNNYIYEIEKHCEIIPSMAFIVSEMWFYLGEPEKGREYLGKAQSFK